MKNKRLELALKKGLKGKVKIILSILVLFLINKSVGYGNITLDSEGKKEEINGKKNEVINFSTLNSIGYNEAIGIDISFSENISINVNEINATVKIINDLGTPLKVKGITNWESNVKISENLLLNAKIEGNDSSITGIIGGIVNNSKGDLTIGKNTKINVEALGEFKSITASGIDNYSYLTLGDNSEINVATLKGNATGIFINRINSSEPVLITGNNIKVKVDILNSNNGGKAFGINNQGGEIITGNDFILETKGKSSNGTGTMTVYSIQNLVKDKKSGDITIKDNSRIITELISDSYGAKYYNTGIINKESKISIGTNMYLKTIGENTFVTRGISNTTSSTINIGETSTIIAAGENNGYVNAIYTDNSDTIIGNGSNISAFGENNDYRMAIWNLNKGKTKIKGGTNIYSDQYAIYNTGGSVLIEDEGYNKKIQGMIQSNGKGTLTSIVLDTDDSYLEGATYKTNEGVFDLGLKNKAEWYVLSASGVSNFNMENGIVDMTQNHKGETIEGKQIVFIDNTTGSGGTYILDISPNDKEQNGNKTDGIHIGKADGPQKNYIQAGKTSIPDLVSHNFGDKINNSILIANTDKNIKFEGSEFSDISNVYDYKLVLEQNVKGETDSIDNWYVTGINKKEGEVVEKVEEDLTLNYMNAVLSRLELDTIHKRLGEIRDYTSEDGVWARIVSGEMEHDKSSGKFKNDYNMLQVGYDKRKETEKGSVFTGFAVHKRDGKTDFRNGDGKNHNIGISMYKSFAYNDNSYTDIILKYSHLDNDYKSYTENNQKLEAEYNTWAGSLSLEHGKKYEKNAWYVTPHVQMDYTYVKGADYSMNSGVRVEQRDIKSLIGRAGIYAGHDFKKSSHFVKAGVLHEFAGEYGAKITGEDASLNKKYSGRDTWVEVGIGGQFKVGKTGTTHLYYDVEKTFGSDFETNWQASVGVRIEL